MAAYAAEEFARPSAPGWESRRLIRSRRGGLAGRVQPLFGHHSPAFTLAVYVHLLPDDLPEPDFLDGTLDGEVEQPSEAQAGAAAS